MTLFLLTSLPLVFLLLLWLPWRSSRIPEITVLLGIFLKGVLIFFPGYIAVVIVRRIFGFSYGGVLLFLSLFLRDQLFPLLAAIGGFLIMKSKLQISGLDEENFLSVFAFLAGFLAMMNIADMARSWGYWDSYLLFLLPLQRLASVIIVSLAARRFFPWEGRDAAFLCALTAALALGLAVPAYLVHVNRPLWSVLVTAAALVAGIFAFAARFPRVVRA